MAFSKFDDTPRVFLANRINVLNETSSITNELEVLLDTVNTSPNSSYLWENYDNILVLAWLEGKLGHVFANVL